MISSLEKRKKISMDFNIGWTTYKYQDLINYLKTFKDEKYRLFNQKIVQSKKKMIGIRTPILRKIAKQIGKNNSLSYLEVCKNHYYEEVLLEGFIISEIKDVKTSLSYFENWILKITEWSTCDMVVSSYKIVKKNKELYFKRIKEYLKNDQEFIVRVGLVLLLDYYIEKEYIEEIFILVDNINREEYYIKMAIAWLLSICYIKYKEETINYLDNNHLDKFTYNKTIQKIIESNRVSNEEKEILRQKKKS